MPTEHRTARAVALDPAVPTAPHPQAPTRGARVLLAALLFAASLGLGIAAERLARAHRAGERPPPVSSRLLPRR